MGMIVADHKDEANAELGLTKQEEFLYNHHLKNLNGKGKVENPDGSISTLFQIGVGIGGKQYNLPTVWDGKILSPEDAIKRAKKEGLEKFPSYSSPEQGEARYEKMHQFMERDTQDYLSSRSFIDDLGYVPPP